MNFCPGCDFMLYTKLIDNKLFHFCKNCKWEGKYISDTDSPCVYRQDYNRDFLAEESSISKYTIDDPTLPRITNIKCINNNCLTNKDFSETFNIEFTSNNELNPNDFITEIDKYHKTINISNQNIEIINLSLYKNIIKYNEADYKKIQLNSKIQLNETNKLLTNNFKKPDREIIYIKYNSLRLKYIYMCSTCRSSWKNE